MKSQTGHLFLCFPPICGYNHRVLGQGKVIHPPARQKEQFGLLEKIKDGLNCPPILCFNMICFQVTELKWIT